MTDKAKQASKNTNNFVDSDEEADADVVLDSSQQQKLTDTKDTQAAKNKKEAQQLQDQGWGAKQLFGGKDAKDEPKPAAARDTNPQKKSGAEGINFGSSIPMFKRQEKGIIDKQSFPDFDDIGKKNDKGNLKKDTGFSNSNSGGFSNSGFSKPSFTNSGFSAGG